MDPNSVDFKIVGGLVGTVGSLIGVLIWLVKSSLPKLLETYRGDILASQQYIQQSLLRAEQGIVDARKEFLAELQVKRAEYVQALKEERTAFINELDKRDKIVDRLTTAVDSIASRVDKLTDRIEDCAVQHRDQREQAK